ncbi:MAG: hypothetical protein KDB74_07105 [Flavobacteriales bacterium]|nr:hypothetical protein [Flavobacteriales bacterium]
MKKKQTKKKTKKKNRKLEILKIYLRLVKKHGFTPTRAVMLENGVSRDAIRSAYTSLESLEEHARKTHPEVFENVLDKHCFTKDKFEFLKSDISQYKRFVITTAICGIDNLDINFYNSIKTYCEHNNAKLLVIPVQDPANRFVKSNWNLDKRLQDDLLVFDDLRLNSNVSIRAIKLSAKQIDPVTGLDRLGQSKGSFIFGSPKQRMRPVSVGEEKMPHVFMSTGSISVNTSYESDYYFSKRTEYLAKHDHIVGAIIVEIEDDDIFHYRTIKANHKGEFIDLAVKYTPTKREFIGVQGFVLGDWHSGETDKTAANAWKEVAQETKPNILVVHDFFNGKFNNHHDAENTIVRAKLALQNKISLQREIECCIRDLNKLSTLAKTVYIVRSNHDEVIERYIREGRYLDDPINLDLASKLISPMIHNHMCLQYLVENLHTLCSTKYKLTAKNIKWLRRDESLKISGIECGAHGDVSKNNAKGSIKNIELGYGPCVVGHSHTPEILREVYRVGTSSILRPDYVRGPSTWMHTSCLIYKDGSRQLINSINGSWKLRS